jgi:hypothetical protein
MAWPDRTQLPYAFDAAGLQGDLAALTGLGWTSHFVKDNYQGTWDVLPLRSPAGARHPIQMIYADPSATAFADTPMLAACPAIRAALAALPFERQSVRLMRLTPGSVITTHRDHDLDAEQGRARLHIPILTNGGVDFRLNGSRVTMAPGSVWYLRLSDPHSVANHGGADRIHLVLDVVVNDHLRGLIDPENAQFRGPRGAFTQG